LLRLELLRLLLELQRLLLLELLLLLGLLLLELLLLLLLELLLRLELRLLLRLLDLRLLQVNRHHTLSDGRQQTLSLALLPTRRAKAPEPKAPVKAAPHCTGWGGLCQAGHGTHPPASGHGQQIRVGPTLGHSHLQLLRREIGL
jgi:hypothetical protein